MPQKEHTFARFDDDLNYIRTLILEMSGLVEMQFKQSTQALFESNISLAHQVIDQDYSVNQLEVRIDNLCITALARQQPAAGDLRSIVIAMKIIVHLERIGDEAKKIAHIAERLSQQNHLSLQQISNVRVDAELVQQKLAEVIKSFARLDTFKAYKLSDSEESNEQFNLIFQELIKSMKSNPRTISTSLEILFVAKAIERIGNHIKHLAKLVIDASNGYSEA